MTRLKFQLGPGDDAPSFFVELDESHPHDKLILRFAEARKPYEPEVYRLFGTVLRPGDTVLDVGAHIGFFTVMAGQMVGPTGRVVAFEAEEVSRSRLRRHVELNRLGNVSVIEQPASHREGEVDFFVHSPGSGGNALWDPALFPGADPASASQVRRTTATTLDAEVQRLGLATPKLIKIDTEGAEQRVLEGAQQLLAGGKVPFVVCELHRFGLRQLGCSPESLRALMQGFGYATFTLFGNGSVPKWIPPLTEIRSQVILNVLFSKPETLAEYWPMEIVDPRQGQ